MLIGQSILQKELSILLLLVLFTFQIQFGFSQNVGIGTTNPQAKLEVMNSIRVGGSSKYLSFDSVSGRFTLINSNLGINNPAPQFPLTFNAQLGDKISLWTDGGPTHYGFGIQSGLLQIFSNQYVDDVAFGWGSSTAFTENVRIKGNGNVGIGNNPDYKLDVSDRMRLRSGGDLANTAGIWLNKTDNNSIQAFFGVENDTYVGLYGNSAWRFGMNTSNGDIKIMGKLGIGTTNPNAPLTFPPALGKKITLYPGGTGDVGFAVQGNLLQIYSDLPNADIAFGYDQGGTMTERFRMKGNGAFSVNGNDGAAGQVLQSTGSTSPPNWVSLPNPLNTLYNNTILLNAPSFFLETDNTDPPTLIPGYTYTFTVATNAKVIVNYNIYCGSAPCTLCGSTNAYFYIYVDGNSVRYFRHFIPNGHSQNYSGTYLVSVSPGTHTIEMRANNPTGPLLRVFDPGNMMLQIIPQQ